MSATAATLAAALQHYLAAVVASGLFGGVYIALTGITLVWSTRVFTRQPARGVGVAFLLIAIGQAGAAPLLGILADHSDLTAAFWAATAFALTGSLLGPRAEHARRGTLARIERQRHLSSGYGRFGTTDPD